MKTMYNFEVIVKNAIIEYCKKEFSEGYSIEDISVVWMNKTLGNKKGVFVDNGNNQRLYEATYNGATDELYLDTYEKIGNITLTESNFNLTVEVVQRIGEN